MPYLNCPVNAVAMQMPFPYTMLYTCYTQLFSIYRYISSNGRVSLKQLSHTSFTTFFA